MPVRTRALNYNFLPAHVVCISFMTTSSAMTSYFPPPPDHISSVSRHQPKTYEWSQSRELLEGSEVCMMNYLTATLVNEHGYTFIL